MAIDITVPQLGESIVEATVVKWFKQEGEAVSTGEALLELETEKVSLEVNAINSGVLVRIERTAGEDVRIGDLLGVLDDSAEVEASEQSEEIPDDRVTPVARRMADEAGISLSGLEGTGMGGRIRREDVERAVAARKEQAIAEPTGTPGPSHPAGTIASATGETRESREEIIPMSRRRRTIASRLVEAQQTAAMLTTFNEIDMSTVMTIRRRNREAFENRHGVRLGFMSFFVKAVIGALRDFPELNGEIRGDSIVKKHYYDIGIAVGAEDGLVVPVLRDADRMSFAEIESGIRQYAARAGEGKLSLEDLRGGTFTITNGGVFGSMLSTPILNPPQVGILGLHRIDDRPVAIDGEVVIRPMMYVALSYDHRIIDGREAVQFLLRIKSLIEVPAALLLEV